MGRKKIAIERIVDTRLRIVSTPLNTKINFTLQILRIVTRPRIYGHFMKKFLKIKEVEHDQHANYIKLYYIQPTSNFENYKDI